MKLGKEYIQASIHHTKLVLEKLFKDPPPNAEDRRYNKDS